MKQLKQLCAGLVNRSKLRLREPAAKLRANLGKNEPFRLKAVPNVAELSGGPGRVSERHEDLAAVSERVETEENASAPLCVTFSTA